ncbi:MAG: hypothetical protein LBE67_00805 [Kocuria palustris]|nr:hypothetical protein [Kocuria palustris]
MSEYGYEASEKIPIWPYERYGLSRKGTEPVARPMGIPWRKYSKTSSRKLRRSLRGRLWKVVFVWTGVWGTIGSLSREKLVRDISWAVLSAEVSEEGVSLLRISMLLFILPFARPFDPVATVRFALERRFERVAFLRVIECDVMIGIACVNFVLIESRTEVGYYGVE